MDENGKVTPLKAGKVTITATAVNGKSASVTLNLVAPKPTKITLNKSGTVFLKKGKTLSLKATLKPEKAEKKLTWKSSKKNVASVSKKGKVKGLKKGVTTVSVTTANGKTDSVKIQVYEPKNPDGVSIKQGQFKQLYVGMKLKLTAVQEPSVCTSPLTWTTSDPTTVTVDGKGNIHALKIGEAVVTVTTGNGKSAAITVNVGRNIADNLRAQPGYWIIKYGQEIYLKSVEIVSPTQIDCEYYLVFNHISGLTTTKFAYIESYIYANSTQIAHGYLENVKISLNSPGVKLFKVSYTGDQVVDTNVNLNAVRDTVHASSSFWLEWNY